MTETILALLQTAAVLLAALQGNPGLPVETQRQIVNSAGQALQFAAQNSAAGALSGQARNSGTWANHKDLLGSVYLNYSGERVALGRGVELEEGDISFGDINGDNRDDAAVIVRQALPGGGERYALAAMLNQGEIMFNAADEPLGAKVQVFDHRVLDQGKFKLDMRAAGGEREIRYYKLTGTQWLRLSE